MERIVTPHDCSLLVGIPTTEAVFRERLQATHGYIAGLARRKGWRSWGPATAWRIYDKDVCTPVLHALERAAACGVDVSFDATLAAFVEQCQRKQVVTLFAHCEAAELGADAVELMDGTLPLLELARMLQSPFDKVLDLALCHSARLGELIKRERPDCLVVTHVHAVQPAFRANFYAGIIALLGCEPRRFTDAAIAVAKRLGEP